MLKLVGSIPLFLALIGVTVRAQDPENIQIEDPTDFRAYTVSEFVPENIESLDQVSDHQIILFDDRTTMGTEMKGVFLMAVGATAVRDMAGDEPRNVTFLHWDPTDEKTHPYLGWFDDFEESEFPDIVWRSQYRYGKFGFKLSGDIEKDAERLSEMIDTATKGRVQSVDCKELEKRVMEKEEMVCVFFGPKELLTNSGNYTHFTEVIALDRARAITSLAEPQEPLIFLQNNDPKCKVKAAGLDPGIHMAIFSPDSDEPIILSESDEKHMKTMQSKVELVFWLDLSVVRINRKWGARAYWGLQLKNAQMITYLEGIHEEDQRLHAFFVTVCDLLREKDVKIICLSGGYKEQNLKRSFPKLEELAANGISVMYFDWATQNVIPYPLDLHKREVRKRTDDETIIVWARYYQVLDAIAMYKRELKSTYSENSEESRDKAKQIRKLLEEAVTDLDAYQTNLEKKGVPHEKIQNKRQDERDASGKHNVRQSRNIKTDGRDASADRAAFRKAQEEDEDELEDIIEEHHAQEEMRLAREQLEKLKRGESIEEEPEAEETDQKEEENKENDKETQQEDL